MDIPPLPPEIRLSPNGKRLTVRFKQGALRKFPVVQLRSAALPTVRRLVASREPHVVIAPHLTQTARHHLEEASWGWIDGDGNARIVGDDLYVRIERPETTRRSAALPVPPQADRIVRLLLDNYPSEFRLTDIASRTELDKGYASRMVRRILESGTAEREGRGPVRVSFPADLFELWSRGPERAETTMWFARGDLSDLVKRVQHSSQSQLAALTGVYAAALLAPHMTPERVEVFVTDRRAAARLGRELGAERVDRGANLHLLIPRDPGIVHIGGTRESGNRLVSTTQIYRDVIQRGRGREREAADFLRRERLAW